MDIWKPQPHHAIMLLHSVLSNSPPLRRIITLVWSLDLSHFERDVIYGRHHYLRAVAAKTGGDQLGWVTVFGRVISQLGQLSLASLRGRLIEYQLRLG